MVVILVKKPVAVTVAAFTRRWVGQQIFRRLIAAANLEIFVGVNKNRGDKAQVSYKQ